MLLLRCIALVFALLANAAASADPGTPGVVGYGSAVTGGKGGTLCFVTTRDDTGTAGSFRYCMLSVSGARTILFRVGGPIAINSAIIANSGNVTIAGQTAPGQGVTFVMPSTASGPMIAFKGINAGNVVIEHVRLRANLHATINYSPLAFENTQASGGFVVRNVSIAFGSDESVVIYKDVYNGSFIDVIASFGLTRHAGGKGIFACVDQVTACGNITIYHTLQSNHGDRNPNGDCTASRPIEVVSSVVSNTDVGAEIWGSEGGCQANIVGNEYRKGPTTPVWGVAVQLNNLSNSGPGVPTVYAPF